MNNTDVPQNMLLAPHDEGASYYQALAAKQAALPGISGVADEIGRGGVLQNSWGFIYYELPVIFGVGEPGTCVQILDGAKVLGEALVDEKGSWRFETEIPLTEGHHAFYAVDKNTGVQSDEFGVILDTIAPSQAKIIGVFESDSATDVPLDNGALTADNTPTLRGTAEPGTLVQILLDGNRPVGVTTAASGTWEYTLDLPMPDGEYVFYARSVDHAGNAGLLSTPYKITVDTSSPAKSSAYEAQDHEDAGEISIAMAGSAHDATPLGHADAVPSGPQGIVIDLAAPAKLTLADVLDANSHDVFSSESTAPLAANGDEAGSAWLGDILPNRSGVDDWVGQDILTAAGASDSTYRHSAMEIELLAEQA